MKAGLLKKIYINGKFFSQRITGTQRYARQLLHEFDNLLSTENRWNIEIEVLVPRSVQALPQYKSLLVQPVGWMNGTNWEQLELPQYCRGHLLFTLSGGAPVLHARNVVTIHDAAVVASPSGYSLAYRMWYASICRRMARTAQHIFTVSNFSKSEIVKWYGAPWEKISVTHLGSDHFSSLSGDPSALTRFGISRKYILAASVQNPNKNFDRLVQAVCEYNKTGTALLIAGGSDSNVYRKIKLPGGIRALGYVTDPELKALYENASCFAFPSFYEGFGLPPLEALSSGCPVVLSRAGSLLEIFRDVAFFCDAYDPEDIGRAIQRAVESSRSNASDLKNFAAKFTWAQCARQTLEIIQDFA
jgi:glycosyltransferase involved in cell wall biosynthesis